MQRPEYLKAVQDFWSVHGAMFTPEDQGTASPVRPPVIDDVRAQSPPVDHGPFGPVTAASRAGMMPEDYAASQGQIRGPDPRPQDPLTPAYQGVANVAAPIIVQPLMSGTQMVEDPSLANVTRFGVDMALSAGRAVPAGMIAGAGLATAAAQDLAPAMVSSANAAPTRQQQPQETYDLPGLNPEQMKLYREAKRQGRQGAMKRLEDISADFSKNHGAAQAEGVRVKAVAEAEAEAAAQRQRQQEYNDQVRFAETARDTELAKKNEFADTATGQVFNRLGPVTPLVVGAATGGVIRSVNARANAANRMADAGRLPSSPGLVGSIKDNSAEIGAGTVAGAVSYNWPLAHNAFLTPVENPEKVAYRAYARELPDGHPKKAEMATYAAGLEDENPTRRMASDDLYDMKKLAERSIFGAAEGALGGWAGGDIVQRAANQRHYNAFETPAPKPPAIPKGPGPRLPQPDLSRMSAPTQLPAPPRQTMLERWQRQNRNPQGRWDRGYRD